eukprot:11197457-Lingulodinium_polyedra.AAC.1
MDLAARLAVSGGLEELCGQAIALQQVLPVLKLCHDPPAGIAWCQLQPQCILRGGSQLHPHARLQGSRQ